MATTAKRMTRSAFLKMASETPRKQKLDTLHKVQPSQVWVDTMPDSELDEILFGLHLVMTS